MICGNPISYLVYIRRAMALGLFLLLSAISEHVLAQADDGLGERVAGSAVARYLDGAELQAETDAQLLAIKEALEDMLHMKPAALKKRRYPDYQGHSQQWTVRQVLEHHFVPTTPMSLSDETLINEYLTREAQAAIRRQLVFVENALKDLP